MDLPEDEDLDNWNFIYLHHDANEKKSIGSVKFTRSGEVHTKIFSDSDLGIPTDRLNLKVGGEFEESEGFNGRFFDP